jgi:NAD(P)-dependent dehydrogenase (short-subunit alcohol dehydrogenase family)
LPAAAASLVIGAGSGMGLAVAKALHDRGPLVVADRNERSVADLAASFGGNVTAAGVDVTDQQQVDALAAQVGPLSALVVTAGLSPTMASGRVIYEVNLIGMARVLRAFAPHLVPGSAAVCFASIAAHGGPVADAILHELDRPLDPDLAGRLEAVGVDVDDSNTAYVLSKVGVRRLPQHLAHSWGKRGLRILSLSPGVIETPMGALELASTPGISGFFAEAPIPRQGRAEELAAVAAFLCSDQASYMTGTDVLVDGGATLIGGLDTSIEG